MTELTVLNPVARLTRTIDPGLESRPPASQRAPRLGGIEDAQLGLWWNLKVGGRVALEWLASEFAESSGTKAGQYYGRYPGAPSLISECAANSTAVIGATGDCGSCTSWLIHDLIEIERQGVPAVALVAKTFVDDARQTAYVMGLPDLAIVEMPQGLTNLTPGQIVEIARNIKGEVVAALTTADVAESGAAALLPSPSPGTFTYTGATQLDALDAFQADFTHERGLGDGFPLVPPTRERVHAMLAGTCLPPDHEVTVLQPGWGSATVEKLAVNAVMAGCKPEHLPVLMAAVEAFSDVAFNPRGCAMSTGPHAPLIVVNGPIVDRLGLNSGRGALGPGKPSAVNTVIGRALRLSMMNIGYTYLGIFDLDTIGTSRKYSMCVAENAGANPWEPISVEHGLGREESAITLFATESAVEVQDMTNDHAEPLLRTFAGTAPMSGAASVQSAYIPTQSLGHHNVLVLCPEHAAVLAREGWDKARIREYMYENTKRPKSWVLNAVNRSIIRPEAAWVHDLPEDALIPIVREVGYFNVIVVGGAGGKSQYHTMIGKPITRSVEPYLPR
jgi:hypothetical protein